MEKPKLKIPEWLDKHFLGKVVKTYKKDDSIEILDFKTNTGFSEHFASTMFQCKIDFKSLKYPKSEHETLKVVIKAQPVDEGLKMAVVSGGPLFETETKLYQEVLPAFHQLFERNGLNVEFGPE
jgi:hypothetical protein